VKFGIVLLDEYSGGRVTLWPFLSYSGKTRAAKKICTFLKSIKLAPMGMCMSVKNLKK